MRLGILDNSPDPLEKFIKEFTDDDVDGFIWKFEFEKKLNDWCKENRFRALSEVAIGKKMKQKDIQQEQRLATWFEDGISKRVRAWVGLKWKDEEKKE